MNIIDIERLKDTIKEKEKSQYFTNRRDLTMEKTISLQELVKIIKRRLFLIISLIFVSAGIAAVINYYLLPPTYEAETLILINQTSTRLVENENAYSQNQTDLQLINTYTDIIQSPIILNKVIDELKLTVSNEALSEQIFISNENNSKVVSIKVQNLNAGQAVDIANKIAEVFRKEVPKLMSINNISVLAMADLGENPTPIKPNKILNVILASGIGLMLGIGLTCLLEMLDTTIKTEKDIEELIELPIIGLVEVMEPEKNMKDLSRSHRVRGT